MKPFKFNDSNVCTNPEIIYKGEVHKVDWNYIKITLATDGKKWDYGYSWINGGSPCIPINGKYKTKSECEQKAIDHIYENCLRIINDLSTLDYKPSIVPVKEFIVWYKERTQLTLF